VNPLVLSGTGIVVPSGTRSSCYRGPESELTRRRSVPTSPRYFPNLEFSGFLLTDRNPWRTVDNARAVGLAYPAGDRFANAGHRQAVVTRAPSQDLGRQIDAIAANAHRILSFRNPLKKQGERRG
jgi:hypothetical protein